MKKILSALTLLAIVCAGFQGSILDAKNSHKKSVQKKSKACSCQAIPQYGKLVLDWSDEFRGDELDQSKWFSQELTGAGSGNNERQIYINVDAPDGKDYTYVKHSKLHIKAVEIPPTEIPQGGIAYTAKSGKVFSKNFVHHGYTEVRAKLPVKNFIFPAIWFFPLTSKNNTCQPNLPVSKYENWPRTGEIDLVEVFGTWNVLNNGFTDPSPVCHNVIGGGPDFWFPSFTASDQLDNYPGLTVENKHVNFHTYGLEWTPDVLRFWLDAKVEDGQIVGGTIVKEIPREQWITWNAMGDSSPDGAPFDQPMPITMNVAIGPVNWEFQQADPGLPPDLPAEMVIDFVRHYKFNNDQTSTQIPKGINCCYGNTSIKGKTKKKGARIAANATKSTIHNNPPAIENYEAIVKNVFTQDVLKYSTPAEKNELAKELAENIQADFASARPIQSKTVQKSLSNTSHSKNRFSEKWSDDFNGLDLNLNFWERRSVSPATLDFLCAATSTTNIKNSFVEEGNLVIQPLAETVTHPFIAPITTISSLSNGVSLPTDVIYVESTQGFPENGGLLVVDTDNGIQGFFYGSKTDTSFTNFDLSTPVSGTIYTGNSVTMLEYTRYFPFETPGIIAELTTAQIESLNPAVGYGYFEVKAKVPVVDSAFTKIELVRLLYAEDQRTVMPYGQILITGQSGLTDPDSSLMGIQYGGPPDTESRSLITNYFTAAVPNRAEWHRYGVEIVPGFIRWWLDAEVVDGCISGGTLLGEVTSDEYYTVNTDGAISTVYNTPFDKNMFIRIAMIPGGGGTGFSQENSYFAGGFPASATYPYESLPDSKLEIDYVKYYELCSSKK